MILQEHLQNYLSFKLNQTSITQCKYILSILHCKNIRGTACKQAKSSSYIVPSCVNGTGKIQSFCLSQISSKKLSVSGWFVF